VPQPKISFTDAELEQMAELEHERWLAERKRLGWSLGSRDDEARTHPSLVPWAELPEAEREKDREAVRAIPGLLASVGWAIVQDEDGS